MCFNFSKYSYFNRLKMNEGCYKAKVIVVGSAGVGKTFLIRRFVSGDTIKQEPTLTVELETKQIFLSNGSVALQLWDTVGQEKYRWLTNSYFAGAELVILVFDVTNPESDKEVAEWLEMIRQKVTDDVPVFLAGNKCDLGEE